MEIEISLSDQEREILLSISTVPPRVKRKITDAETKAKEMLSPPSKHELVMKDIEAYLRRGGKIVTFPAGRRRKQIAKKRKMETARKLMQGLTQDEFDELMRKST